MTIPRSYAWPCALAALLACLNPAHADYVTQNVSLHLPYQWNVTGGTVQLETYDGQGPAGGGLNAGEARLTFSNPGDAVPGVAVVGGPPPLVFAANGFQAVGFNTDLNLAPSQIHAPANWVLASGLSTGGLQYTWGVGTLQDFQGEIRVLITGLGADAAPAHFLLPPQTFQDPILSADSAFIANWVDIFFGSSATGVTSSWVLSDDLTTTGVPPAETPEPGSLILAGLGTAGLLWSRRGRLTTPRTVGAPGRRSAAASR